MKNLALLHRPLLIVALLLLAASPASASQIVVVTPTAGNPTQSGNDLLAALAGITGNSWGKRFVLQLEPGVYNLGSQNIQMKQYVDIAGSGVDSTFVYGNGNTDAQNVFRGLIQGADFAELRDLTVRVFAAADRQYLVPIFLPASSPTTGLNTRITNVHTQAFTADEYCGAIFGVNYNGTIENVNTLSSCDSSAFGIVFDGPAGEPRQPVIRRTHVIASNTGTSGSGVALLVQGARIVQEIRDSSFVGSGGGTAMGLELESHFGSPVTGTSLIINSTFVGQNGSQASRGLSNEPGNQQSLRFENCTVKATGTSNVVGIFSPAWPFSTITVENGVVEGATNTVDSIGTVLIGASRLAGGPVTGGGTITCAGVHDENFTFSASTCP